MSVTSNGAVLGPGLGPFPGYFQVGYVTNDFERAMQVFGATHGITRFQEHRPMRYDTINGKKAECNIALAYLGAVEIELIHPLDGDVQFYRDFLPEDGFAVRFHHLCKLFDSRDALEHQVALYRQQGRRFAVDAESPGTARYFYADFRADLGHYIEGIAFEPQARPWLESIPRN